MKERERVWYIVIHKLHEFQQVKRAWSTMKISDVSRFNMYLLRRNKSYKKHSAVHFLPPHIHTHTRTCTQVPSHHTHVRSDSFSALNIKCDESVCFCRMLNI